MPDFPSSILKAVADSRLGPARSEWSDLVSFRRAAQMVVTPTVDVRWPMLAWAASTAGKTVEGAAFVVIRIEISPHIRCPGRGWVDSGGRPKQLSILRVIVAAPC